MTNQQSRAAVKSELDRLTAEFLAMKKKALARLEAPDTKMRRFRAPDSLTRFLQTL